MLCIRWSVAILDIAFGDPEEVALEDHEQSSAGGWGRELVAFLLTLVVPGAGHFLVGNFRRGIVWAVSLSGIAVLSTVTVRIPFTSSAAMIIGLLGRIACVLDVSCLAIKRPRWALVLLGWGGLAIASVLVSVVKEYNVQAFTIPHQSMTDTLLHGDYILVDKSSYRTRVPRRGDIVVFSYPVDEERNFIYRIVGTPGETLQLRGQGVLIDGRLLEEPYIRDRRERRHAGDAPASCHYAYGCDALVIPSDAYFVMGDNRNNANDSRNWGFVKREKIKGKAEQVYWSWDGDRHWLRWWRLGHRIS